MKDVEVKMLTTKEFQGTITLYKLMGVVDINFQEEFMFVTLEEDNEPVIYVDEETTSYMNDDEFMIAMNHEYGHTTGIINEEDTDRFALEYLNEIQRNILIDQWEDRHGHVYSL